MARALKFIFHTFRLIFGNLKQALHITVPWFFLLVLLVIGFGLLAGTLSTGPNPIAFLMFPVIFIASALALGSTAVVWHRYILLDEQPTGIVPMPEWRVAFRYFWRALGITFIVLAIIIIPMFLLMRLTASLNLEAAISGQFSVSNLILFSLPQLLLGVFAQYFFYRFALSLPAAALLKFDFKLGDAWQSSKVEHTTIIWIVVLTAIAAFLVSALLTYPFIDFSNPEEAVLPLPITLINIVFQWFYFMFSIGILTTLYGVIEEGREI